MSATDAAEDTECPTCGRDDFKNKHGVNSHHARVHGEKLTAVTLACERCGDEYEVKPYRADESRFCSNQCRKNRTTLECERCGNEYKLPASDAKSSRFCSQECRKNRVVLECEWCGGEYETQKHKAKTSRFCSRECLGEQIGSEQPTDRVELTCEQCEDQYERVKSAAKRSRFCSGKCLSEWQSEHRSGQGHPRWGGGRVDYGEGWHARKKRRVRIRDQARCQDCGMTESDHYSEYGRVLDVHHITPAREFKDGKKRNAMENLISLCVRCHTEWEKIAPLRPDTAAVGD